jgi:glycerophosphoryl diester phosphodiesterase
VRLARDGVPVVIHDATLLRTGLTMGVVAKMTSTQLAKIDVGSWFERTHARFDHDEYQSQCVPTLAQVLELCSKTSGTVYIELKSEDASMTIDLVQSVAEIIKKLKLSSRSIVVSFDLEAVLAMKQRDASIRTGGLFAFVRKDRMSRSQPIISAAIDAGADEILLHRLLARAKSVEKAIDRNLSVVVWTVDDPKWVSRAQNLGISALITNDPAKLVQRRLGNSAIV